MPESEPIYPVGLRGLEKVRCVVVGGGEVAARKVIELVRGGACPVVISPALAVELEQLYQQHQLEHIARLYEPGDLERAWLVIAATNDRAANAAIAAEATQRGILVNIADQPSEGNFHTLATVRRGDLLLAVSTSGGSPALAAFLRRDLEQRYGEEYAHLATLLKSWRNGPLRTLPAHKRRALWNGLDFDALLKWLHNGEPAHAEAYLNKQISEYKQD